MRLPLWWPALFGLWLLLVGTSSWLELVGGACAATAAVALVATVRHCSERRIDVPWGEALRFAPLPWRIVRDFGAVLRELTLPRRHGTFRAVPAAAGGDNPRSRGRRALLTILGSVAPNTYVVDIDREGKTALAHDLDPRSGRKQL